MEGRGRNESLPSSSSSSSSLEEEEEGVGVLRRASLFLLKKAAPLPRVSTEGRKRLALLSEEGSTSKGVAFIDVAERKTRKDIYHVYL